GADDAAGAARHAAVGEVGDVVEPGAREPREADDLAGAKRQVDGPGAAAAGSLESQELPAGLGGRGPLAPRMRLAGDDPRGELFAVEVLGEGVGGDLPVDEDDDAFGRVEDLRELVAAHDGRGP